MREAATEALRERASAAGKQSPISPELAAVVGLAVGRGIAMEKLADASSVDDESIAELLAALTV